MDNYIMFEGRKIPLTDEQVAALKNEHLGESQSYHDCGRMYFYIAGDGTVRAASDSHTLTSLADNRFYNIANSRADSDIRGSSYDRLKNTIKHQICPQIGL